MSTDDVEEGEGNEKRWTRWHVSAPWPVRSPYTTMRSGSFLEKNQAVVVVLDYLVRTRSDHQRGNIPYLPFLSALFPYPCYGCFPVPIGEMPDLRE